MPIQYMPQLVFQNPLNVPLWDQVQIQIYLIATVILLDGDTLNCRWEVEHLDNDFKKLLLSFYSLQRDAGTKMPPLYMVKFML